MSSTSPFFDLPGELRNTIYKLVFTASKPLAHYKPRDVKERPYLYLDDTPGVPVAHDKTPVEYNQLKYVSKQVHAETVGLELKYNDITFYAGENETFPGESQPPTYPVPSKELTEWILSIPRPKRSLLKTVSVRVLKEHVIPGSVIPMDPDHLARLTSLCNDIPSMTVKYHLPAWTIGTSKNALEFFLAANQVRLAIRRKGFDEFFSPDDADADNFRAVWMRNHNGGPSTRLEDLQADNLRYYPDIPEGFRVPVVRETYAWVKDYENDVSEDEQDIGNTYIKEWIEHGI